MALIKCIDCGIEYSSHAINCPKCGCPSEVNISSSSKNNDEVSHDEQKAIEANPTYTNSNIMENRLTSDLSAIKDKNECERIDSRIDKSATYKKIVLISTIIVVLLAVVFGIYKYYYNSQVDSHLRKLHEEQIKLDASRNLKIKRIYSSLTDQTKYWNLVFSEWSWWYGQNPTSYTVNEDMFCVVVGITFEKNKDSVNFLDNSYDGGLFSFSINKLRLSDKSLFSTTYQPQCFNAYNHYDILWSENIVDIKEGETYFVLAKLYRSQLEKDNIVKYNDFEIVNLGFTE